VIDRKGGALVVPLQAVNQGSEHTGVLVVNASNQIEERLITLGIQTDTGAEVLSGLKEGDLVVISDRSGLRSGETVHPKLTETANYQGQS
jgi:multidrug efflux pump subunit AcrA (membrane-fusion protein)